MTDSKASDRAECCVGCCITSDYLMEVLTHHIHACNRWNFKTSDRIPFIEFVSKYQIPLLDRAAFIDVVSKHQIYKHLRW